MQLNQGDRPPSDTSRRAIATRNHGQQQVKTRKVRRWRPVRVGRRARARMWGVVGASSEKRQQPDPCTRIPLWRAFYRPLLSPAITITVHMVTPASARRAAGEGGDWRPAGGCTGAHTKGVLSWPTGVPLPPRPASGVRTGRGAGAPIRWSYASSSLVGVPPGGVRKSQY